MTAEVRLSGVRYSGANSPRATLRLTEVLPRHTIAHGIRAPLARLTPRCLRHAFCSSKSQPPLLFRQHDRSPSSDRAVECCVCPGHQVPAGGGRFRAWWRGVWPSGERFPASVRWLPCDVVRRVGVSPQLPTGAAGCLVYRFGSPGEPDTYAAQLEAVSAHGERLLFGAAGKRPAVAGSDFDRGRRMFHAGGGVDRGVHLVEGPLDALALVHLERLGDLTLHGGVVFGAQGTPGFTARACPGRGAVVLWPDGDGPGETAAVRLKRELRRAGRDVAIRLCVGDVTARAFESSVRTRGNPT